MATDAVERVALDVATEERYLEYAMSVITSRALPDVRDGLKPVQRRILYAMYNDLSLHPTGRYRKSASVVGNVISNYHPHGDQAVYDALVRMAQDFTLLHPLVDGQGNFGSLDGDPPAAYRYTECKLRPLAEELLTEIKKRTVDFRPNFDGQRFEPVVLPAQFPHLLVMGCEGIAVGMATRIPPHNLGEVIDAAVALIENPKLGVGDLLNYIQGPDFPTGARILATRQELQQIYSKGRGSFKVQATWEVEQERRRKVILTSIPYGQNKAKLVETIGAEVSAKRLPQVVDVRDESTTDVRIVLELKQGASAEAVMAYLFRRTHLQTNWSINLTALVPRRPREDEVIDDVEAEVVATPATLDLQQILQHWLAFRFETVRRRYSYDLEQLEARIHILEGFALIFDALDEAIALIRGSDGKRDAAEKLIARFSLSEEQADAILDLRLYRLARLEMKAIADELADKRTEAKKIERILKSNKRLWTAVKRELMEIRKIYVQDRRTIVGLPQRELEFSEDAYIINEDAYVVVTRDGWIKRQSSYRDLSKIRIREDDSVGWLFLANTRSTFTVFTTHGSAYVMKVDAVPSTHGYGEPLSAHFSFADGERVVRVETHDERHHTEGPSEETVAVTTQGRMMRFPTKPHTEPSNKSGRRFARLNEGDQVFAVYALPKGNPQVAVATKQARAATLPVHTIPLLKAPGKGVAGIKLGDDDVITACEITLSDDEGPTVVTSRGREVMVTPGEYGLSGPGARGIAVLKKGTIDRWEREPTMWLGPPEPETDDEPVDGGEA